MYDVLFLRYKVSVNGSGCLVVQLFSWLVGWLVGGLKSKLCMKLVAIYNSLEIDCVRI